MGQRPNIISTVMGGDGKTLVQGRVGTGDGPQSVWERVGMDVKGQRTGGDGTEIPFRADP